MEGMTYTALRRITVHGEVRHQGDLVPEAESWRNKDAYIRTGYISPVPRASVNAEALEAAEAKYEKAQERAREQEEEAPEETSEGSYDDLTAQQVMAKVDSGELDRDEALEAELNREKPRKGVLNFLEDDEEE
jgi:hypothetical protein